MSTCETVRTCYRCGKSSAETPFREDKKNSSGLHSWCRECYRAWAREWSRNNKDKVTAKRRKRKESNYGRAVSLYHSAKRRAHENGIEFSLTVQWIELQLQSGKCSRTGIAFDMGGFDASGSRRRNKLAPSLDRIDNNCGYSEENCIVVIWMYNLAKNQWCHDDLMQMAAALLTNSGYLVVKPEDVPNLPPSELQLLQLSRTLEKQAQDQARKKKVGQP